MPSGRGVPPDPKDARAADAAGKGVTPARPVLPPPLPLAHGELTPADALELRALKEQIRTASGLFCEGYKEKCLRRRLAVRMRARGVHRYADYAALLDADPAEYARLIDTVTINVSKFYRNPEVWDAVRDLVLPDLLSKTHRLHAWSAGTATGEEPYTLAMLLREAFERAGRTDVDKAVAIEGTDIDAQALARARIAVYPALALVETPDAARARWFEPGGPPFRVVPEIRSMVRFTQGDLIQEPARADLDLIFCRNLFIYFEPDLQETIMSRFAEALRPGGWLVLGKVETLLGGVTSQLEAVCPRERIYRKR